MARVGRRHCIKNQVLRKLNAQHQTGGMSLAQGINDVVAAKFTRYDLNGDGVIDSSELPALALNVVFELQQREILDATVAQTVQPALEARLKALESDPTLREGWQVPEQVSRWLQEAIMEILKDAEKESSTPTEVRNSVTQSVALSQSVNDDFTVEQSVVVDEVVQGPGWEVEATTQPLSSEVSEEFCGYGLENPARRNFLALMIVAFVASFDFVCATVSIQAFYHVLDGNSGLFGFAVGVYDFMHVMTVPIFNNLVEMVGFKAATLAGLFLTVLGNIMYLSLVVVMKDGAEAGHPNQGWIIMLVARAIMGCGSAVLIVGVHYIATHTSLATRYVAIGQYRVFMTLARGVGPLIGLMFVTMAAPCTPVMHGSISQTCGGVENDHQLFNFYTMPALLTVFVGVIAMGAFMHLFDSCAIPMLYEADHTYPMKERVRVVGSMGHLSLITYGILALWSICYSSISNQIFNFSLARWKVVRTQSDIFKPFLTLVAGGTLATLLWHQGAKNGIGEKRWLFPALALLLGSTMGLIQYTNDVPPESMLYVSMLMMGAASPLFISNLEIIYMKTLTWKTREVGCGVPFFMGGYDMSAATGRFIGSFLSGAWINLNNDCSAVYDYFSTQYLQAAWTNLRSTDSCPLSSTTVPSYSQTCCVYSSFYCVGGCDITDANGYLIFTAVVVVAAMVLLYYFLKVATYDQEEVVEIKVELGITASNKAQLSNTKVP